MQLTPISRVMPPAREVWLGRIVTVAIMVSIVIVFLKTAIFLVG